jgi:anti-sigma regulatory factor (Ser/Thr protein kinase)
VPSLELPPASASATRAREFARDELGTRYARSVVDDVSLLVTEMVTNAVLHAGTPLRVTLELAPEAVRVEVEDGSPDPPSRRDDGADVVSGRGLRLVEGIASSWGTDRVGAGKRVWCVVPVASATVRGRSRRGRPRP